MKIKILIALAILFLSCKNRNSNLLIGSWKLKDVVDYSGQNASDKLTLFPNGTAVAEVFANKKVVTRIKGKYVFDKENEIIKMFFANDSIVYKVQKLDDDELDLLDLKTKRLIRNVRVEPAS